MEGETTKKHKEHSPINISCAIITLSDSRNIETDDSGKLIKSLLEKEGHIIVEHLVIPDDGKILVDNIKRILPKAKVIITNGGTGIAKRDITPDVIEPLFRKKLSAFSIIYTLLSYEEIGSAALVSRATAGVIDKTVVFCMPGSPKAVELGMEKLILPELGHIINHLN